MQSVPNSETSIRACPTCGRQYRAADEQNERCAFDGSTTIVVHADRLVNQVICEKFRIIALIGVGAWSEVYRAVDLQTGAPFAVKILHSHLAADPLNVARFTREADVLLQLKHRCFAAIYEQGVVDGKRPCLVMEYLVGMSLDNYLSSVGRLTLSQALELFMPVCEALAGAHEKGLLHRDLKPSNIFLVEKDGVLTPKILDFGLAKMFLLGSGGALASLTQSGEILGTPAYMSPEQCQGNVLDQRSDLYALGCMIYEGLTNKKAIPGKTAFEAMSNQIGRIPDPMNDACPEANVPEEAEALIFQLLSKDPLDRFDDAREFASAFRSAVELAKNQTSPTTSRTRGSTKDQSLFGALDEPPLPTAGDGSANKSSTQSLRQKGSGTSTTASPPIKLPPNSATSPASGSNASSGTSGSSATSSLSQSRNIQLTAGAAQAMQAGQPTNWMKQLTHPVMLTLVGVGVVATGGLIWLFSGMVDSVYVAPPAVKDSDSLLDLSHKVSTTDRETAKSDAMLRNALMQTPPIKVLSLPRAHFSAAGLSNLELGKSLEQLGLRGCSDVDDKTIAHLAQLNLVKLDLSGTSVTGECLKYLRSIKTLRSLDLSSTQISDADCAVLGTMPLIDLNLSSTKVTGAGLKSLAVSKSLIWLFLDDTKIGDQISALNPMHLTWLSLKATDFGDHDLAALDLPTLEQLNIDYTKITDIGLLTIAKRKALKTLWIQRCSGITPDGVAKLKAAVAERGGKMDIFSTGMGQILDRAKRAQDVIIEN